MANMTPEEIEKIKRAALFIPCNTKEQLHRWIKVYLELDMPNCIVCDDDVRNPPSNSSPMDLIWELYSKAREGTDPNFAQCLGFSAREGFKTLSAAVLEMLCLCHLKRSVGHVAALEVQAKNCQKYVERFFNRPILREFLTSKNKRTLEMTRYENRDGEIISPVQYEALPNSEKQQWESKAESIQIVVATPEACNGLHVPFLVMDELDLTDPEAIEEAKMIPVSTESGELPITFLTSTRKYSFGEVQKEINRADKTNLQIRHWNIIDVTESCPPKRHLPDEPKIPIFYSENQLVAIGAEEHEKLTDKEKQNYEMKEGYAGCLKNCKMFAACKGRLATKQTSKSPLLKKIDHTQSTMAKVSVDTAKAQYMCWKPSSEGLVYPYFSRELHMITAADMAFRITGEEFDKNFNKQQLIDLIISLGGEFHCGLDWGFTHKFAVVTAALIGHILYVIDVISVTNLELPEKIELCKERLSRLKPTIYPDNAYPADIKTFKRNGFRMIDFKKDVLGGIEAVRTRVMPGSGKLPTIFMLKDDFGCELLATKMIQYHWKLDKATGQLTDEPDKADDDELDALRYLGQNVPIVKSKMSAHFGEDQNSQNPKNPNEGWIKRKVAELTADGDENSEVHGKPGGIMFII